VSDIGRIHRDGSLIETIEVQCILRREPGGVVRLICAL
jgi:hypothetical protein